MKKHKTIKLILLSFVSGFATLTYLTYMHDLVKEEDLTRVSSGSTSWMVPRQWRKYNEESRRESDDNIISTIYGDGLSKDNKSSTVLMVKQRNRQTALTNALPEYYETLRKSYLNEFDPNQIRDELASDSNVGCKQTPKINKSIDRFDTNGVVGLFSVDASCPTRYSLFTIKIRLVVGRNDGIVRSIYLSSYEFTWKKNEAVFNKILDSISASGSYAMKTTLAQN